MRGLAAVEESPIQDYRTSLGRTLGGKLAVQTVVVNGLDLGHLLDIVPLQVQQMAVNEHLNSRPVIPDHLLMHRPVNIEIIRLMVRVPQFRAPRYDSMLSKHIITGLAIGHVVDQSLGIAHPRIRRELETLFQETIDLTQLVALFHLPIIPIVVKIERVHPQIAIAMEIHGANHPT